VDAVALRRRLDRFVGARGGDGRSKQKCEGGLRKIAFFRCGGPACGPEGWGNQPEDAAGSPLADRRARTRGSAPVPGR